MRHIISTAVVLAFIWLVNSGQYSPLFIGFGVVSIALVIWLTHRMDVIDHESQPIHLTKKLPAYYLWLLKEVVLSNIQVVREAWRPHLKITPQFEKLPLSQKTDMGRVIYANSINLTPGTLTVDLKDDYVLVHSLTEKGLSDLKTGEMDRRVTEVE